MPRRVLCKYFARGTCFKGEYCQFSHDWRDQSNKVCTFYQKGLCTYGSRCRYNHVMLSPQETSDATSSNSYPHVESGCSHFSLPSRALLNGQTSQASTVPAVVSHSSQCDAPLYRDIQAHRCAADVFPHKVECIQAHRCVTDFFPQKDECIQAHRCVTDVIPHKDEGIHAHRCVTAHYRPADIDICSLNIDGTCPHGERCCHIHGDMCSICEKPCLHPFRPVEREEHMKMCQKIIKLRETLKYSKEIECSICLERVLSKSTAAERKFGILSECDHPFCIQCIRNWRKNSPASGIDLNTALRACPVCRKHSYFVIPSVTWFSSSEEKRQIIDSYKDTLKSIDCKYFEFGNGTCPFGSSCFYKHNYKPHAIRGNGYRFRRHRPRPHRSMQLMEDDDEGEEELDDIIDQFVMNQELANLAALLDADDEEEPDNHEEEEDLGSLLAMSFLLMHMEDEELLSEEDE